jgi:peroxiredoxin
MNTGKFFTLVAALMMAAFLRVSAQADQALVGATAPAFSLMNIDGKTVALDDFKSSKGVIVIFTCNHCPYSIKYEDRIIALDKKMKAQGFPVVAINPNDVVAYPADNFKNMKKRAKKKGFTFPYLMDDTQEIAKAYGATRTPHLYLLMNEGGAFKVRYVGAIDDNTETESVTVNYVETAVDRLMKGEDPTPSYTKAVGCGIKWKQAQ